MYGALKTESKLYQSSTEENHKASQTNLLCKVIRKMQEQYERYV